MKMKALRILAVAVVLLLGIGTPVLAAITAPAITPNAATYVAQTTAQLNATVTDDGGEACDVRWGYDTETRVAFDDYANKTDWDTTGYTTDDYPLASIASLNANDEYFWAVQIRNTHSTVTSSELTFTTEVGVAVPTNPIAIPRATQVILSWTKGVGASFTVIRHSGSTYPTSVTDGTHVYLGVLSNYTHTGLDTGSPHYYSIWSRSGGTDSATYVTVMATTSAEAVIEEDLEAPTVPSTWWQTPDYTVFENIPFYDQINEFFDSFEIPKASGWLFSGLFGCMVVALVVFGVSKKPMPTLIALSVSLTLASLVKLLPMYMMAFAVIVLIGAWQLRGAE